MSQISVRQAEVSDIDRIAELRSIGFGSDEKIVQQHILANPRYTLDDIVVAELAGEIAGTACAFPTQMWLSGVPVSMGAVAAVTTHPRYRMRGVARAMMESLLHRMAENGLAISTLFPAEHTMYYRYGYAPAAIWHAYSISPQNLPYFEDVARVRDYRPDDCPALQSLYRGTQLSRCDGRLSRSVAWWKKFTAEDQRVGSRKLVVFDDGGVEGYAKFSRVPDRVLKITEFVAHTDAAYRGLWAFIGAQAEIDAIQYLAPPDDPIYHLLNTPTDSEGGNRGWIFNDIFHATSTFMLRVINLSQALTARFYPADLRGKHTLKINDPHLPQNSRPLTLRIVDGRAETHLADTAPDIETDIVTFSQIYAGFIHPADARRLGKLAASEDAVAWLARAMAIRPLYMPQADWF